MAKFLILYAVVVAVSGCTAEPPPVPPTPQLPPQPTIFSLDGKFDVDLPESLAHHLSMPASLTVTVNIDGKAVSTSVSPPVSNYEAHVAVVAAVPDRTKPLINSDVHIRGQTHGTPGEAFLFALEHLPDASKYAAMLGDNMHGSAKFSMDTVATQPTTSPAP